MPPSVTRYTPDELKRGAEWISKITPEQIERDYRTGKISLNQKLETLQAYGKIKHELAVQSGGGGATGEIKDWFQGVVKEYAAGWRALTSTPPDKVVGAIAANPTPEEARAKLEKFKARMEWEKESGPLNALFHDLMGTLKALAVFDIPGNTLERWALEADVPPSLARATNWAAWGLSNFYGVGAVSKAPLWALGKSWQGVKATRGAASQMFAKKALEESLKVEAPEALSLSRKIGATVAEHSAPEALPMTPRNLDEMAVDELIAHYQGKAAQFIRKPVSHAETQAEARSLTLEQGIANMESKTPKVASAAAQLEEMAQTHKQIRAGLDSLMDEALPAIEEIAAGNRPDLVSAFKWHLAAIDRTNPAFLGGLEETARGLEYAKALQPELQSARMLDTLLKSLGTTKLAESTDAATAEVMQKLALLSNESRAQFLEAAGKETSSGILHSFFKNLLFSVPGTHLANIAGSLTGMVSTLAERTGAAMLPFAKDAPTMRQVIGEWTGLIGAMASPARLAKRATEESAKSLEKAGLSGATSRFTPARLLGWEDEFTGGMMESALVQGKAIENALASGAKSNEEIAAFVQSALDNPKTVAEYTAQVKGVSEHALFHDNLSAYGEEAAALIRKSKLDFYLPVVKTPINLIKYARDWTPGLQLTSTKLLDDLAAGGAREAMARSRITLSWMMSQGIWAACKAGIITGGGPTDPQLNAEWSKNNLPYAIYGHSYRWAEPFASPVGFVCDLAQISNQVSEDDQRGMAAAATVATSRMVENNYWLRIMEGLTQFVGDMKKGPDFMQFLSSFGKLAASPVVTVATGGPIGGRVREWFDPEVKDLAVKDLSDTLNYYKAKVPGWSLSVPPKLNYSGEPVLIPPALGSRYLNVFFHIRSQDQKDPVGAFLVKNDLQLNDEWGSYQGQVDPAAPLSTPTGMGQVQVSLSAAERHDWKKLSLRQATRSTADLSDPNAVITEGGKTWIQSVEELDRDPRFNAMSRYDKQRRVSYLYNHYRDLGWRELVKVNPDIKARSDMAKQLTREMQGRPDAPFAQFGIENDAKDIQPTPEIIEQDLQPSEPPGGTAPAETISGEVIPN